MNQSLIERNVHHDIKMHYTPESEDGCGNDKNPREDNQLFFRTEIIDYHIIYHDTFDHMGVHIMDSVRHINRPEGTRTGPEDKKGKGDCQGRAQ